MPEVESGENFKIVEEDGEKLYTVNLPDLSPGDRQFIADVLDRTIRDLSVNLDAISDQETRKGKLRDEVLKTMLGEIGALKSGVKKRARFEVPDDKKLAQMCEIIIDSMIGYGAIESLLSDDALEEVMVIGINAPVYVAHRKYGALPTNIVFEDDADIQRIIEKIARFSGRKIDIANPLLDARLPDGSRVNATLRPASLDGSTITIRKFKAESLSIIDIIKFGTFSSEVAAFMWLAVDGMGVKPANILVSGGTGSGKTTTLNCLGVFVPKADRVITIEDTAELQLPLQHMIRLETKPPNVEGKGGLSFDQLLINTLRMRPDRLILGEVRGGEAATLFVAMNTGHDGCMGTAHANTANETITRLINAPMSVPLIMIPAMDLIIMQNRVTVGGKVRRRVTEIAEVAGTELDKVLLNKIYEHDPKDDKVKSTGTPSHLKQNIAKKVGISGEDLNVELEKRAIVLDYLVSKGITKLDDVYTWIQDYYKDSDAVLKKIQSGA
ncbi:MAG: CpaF family protein [Candidatus Hydrothermarchaeaceae archaeon]